MAQCSPSPVRVRLGLSPPKGGPRQPGLPMRPPAQVHGDYDCTLNQTNIGNNNNKFYLIQLLEDGDRFACWNRWGRVVSAHPAPCRGPPLTSPCSALPPAAQGPHSTQAERP